ncbi:DNA-(apurinic or apyrimidinic site) lyase [Nephila pilipes]|uniref:DNA-(apurinic or apyrimidinic site) endonuclease n=1 Tax=Nephila pilipes TaxID=299642 RepID=A0A8X6TVS1_NEPPI|nr:DNA-(apurinic or apyrimidinic site) lyase [Nephila pilipes]
MAERSIRRGRSKAKELNGHVEPNNELVVKKGKSGKTDPKNAAKTTESSVVETKDIPKKRGNKQLEPKPSGIDNVSDEILSEDQEVKDAVEDRNEVKDLPAKRGRKKITKSGDSVVANDTEQDEDLPVKKSKRAGKKPTEQPAEVAASVNSTYTVSRDKKKKVQKTDSKIVKKGNVKEKSAMDETRQLKVALKRNRSLDEMAATQLLENTDTTEEYKVKTTKGSSKGKAKRAAEDNTEDSKPVKKTKESASKSNSGKKEKIPDVTALDFGNESKTADGKAWNLKVASWNVNGIRAWLEKNGMSYLHHEKPDILCLQETKCSDDKLPSEVNVEGYHSYWLSGDKDGYSGVGLLSKKKPLSVQYGIGMEKHDNEGRVITAEYEQFYLVATYVPNAGRGLVRLDYRQEWDVDLCAYLKKLDEKKPVVLCGDLNVAHEEIDLANPKTNKKNAGFTKEEREGFSTLLSEGFVDTFRHLYPDVKGAYTFWTYMMNARAKNVGWRLDYFVISKKFVSGLCDSIIRKDVYGSDHCPICLFLHV